MSEILETNGLPSASITAMNSVIGIGTDGEMKKTPANALGRVFLIGTFSGAQWVRVFKLNGSAAGLFTIYHSWNIVEPQPMLIAFSFPSSQNDAATNALVGNLFGKANRFTKARIVYPATKSGAIKECYLELYKANSDGGVRLESQLYQNATPCLEAGSIPEDYTSKEIALASVIGGGKALHSIRRLAERRAA